MRIINKPDLKQTLITTGVCAASGLLYSFVVTSPLFFGLEAAAFLLYSLVWGFAVAWSARHMPGARRMGMVVFPFVSLAGWLCGAAIPSALEMLGWTNARNSLGVQINNALIATISFTLFNVYHRRKVPLLNYVIAFALGWLAMKIINAGFKLRFADDSSLPMAAVMTTTWGTVLGLGVALSLPKARDPQEALEEEFNLLK